MGYHLVISTCAESKIRGTRWKVRVVNIFEEQVATRECPGDDVVLQLPRLNTRLPCVRCNPTTESSSKTTQDLTISSLIIRLHLTYHALRQASTMSSTPTNNNRLSTASVCLHQPLSSTASTNSHSVRQRFNSTNRISCRR